MKKIIGIALIGLLGSTVFAQNNVVNTLNDEKVELGQQRELRKKEYLRLQSEESSAELSQVEASKARAEREKRKAVYLKTQSEQKPSTIPTEAERKAIKEERIRRFNSINNSRTEK